MVLKTQICGPFKTKKNWGGPYNKNYGPYKQNWRSLQNAKVTGEPFNKYKWSLQFFGFGKKIIISFSKDNFVVLVEPPFFQNYKLKCGPYNTKGGPYKTKQTKVVLTTRKYGPYKANRGSLQNA